MPENVSPDSVTTVPITQQDKSAAALSYIWIMSILMLLARRNSPFVRFHASQGIALFIASLVVWFIPVISNGLLVILGLLMIMGFFKAARGEYFRIPLFYQLAHRDNPVRSLLVMLQKLFMYIGLFVQSLLVKDSSARQALEKARQELFRYGREDSIEPESQQSRKKDMAAFGYLWIFSIVVVSTHKQDEFVAFHASQGVVLFMLSVLFLLLPGIGFYLNVIVLLLTVAGFIMAMNGEKYKLPVVGYFASAHKTFEQWYLDYKSYLVYGFLLVSGGFGGSEKYSLASVREQVNAGYQKKKAAVAGQPVTDTDIATASYFLLAPLTLLIHKTKPFVLFHARQAFVLVLFLIIFLLLEPLRGASFLVLGLLLLGGIKAAQGEYYPLPLIFDMATSQLQIRHLMSFLSRLLAALFYIVKRVFGATKTASEAKTPPSAP